MWALVLLMVSTAQPADPHWEIFDRNVVAGQVPQLLPPPANLPLTKTVPEGTLLPQPLDGYVAVQLAALRLYPPLAQQALDLAVAAERRAGDLRVADVRAAEPTWLDRLKAGALWSAGGLVLGVVVTAYVLTR
jgi:hypothetical protein